MNVLNLKCNKCVLSQLKVNASFEAMSTFSNAKTDNVLPLAQTPRIV